MKDYQKTLPSLQELELVRGKIKGIRNRQGEYKRQIHYGCYLLCSQSGLRVNEAVKFDLKAKTSKGLYRIEKPKGKSERLVYVPKEVVKELKASNWQPNQTNRFTFYHFLKKVKRELGISKSIELSPHTLRRSFATYHAEAGLPLPLLQKLLGHSSIRTTALYWRNIYADNDTDDILKGKRWLEKPKEPPKPPSKNFALPEIPTHQPTINPNSPPIITEKPPTIAIKTEPPPLITKIPTQSTEKNLLNSPLNKASANDFSSVITEAKISITNNEQLSVITNSKENKKEEILLEKIKNLEGQLKQTQTENSNLKGLVKSEKERADNYQQQLKTVAKALYQWQKINYYQQLKQEQEAKIEQAPTPWKPNK